MIKRILLFLTVVFFIFSFHINKTESALAQEIKIEDKKVEYILPYPGILPDHPLYFIKAIRDRLLEFFTRDHLKKTELYLLLSDKTVGMTRDLIKKGKWPLASETATKGEEFFLRMIQSLETSKKQGVTPSGDFILKMKLSNEKHKEVIENLLKDIPQGERKAFEEVLVLNKKIKGKL